MPSFDPVIALGRGIEVLRVVNQLGEATISHIHRETNIHKSTILRMLETLIHEGYVARQPDSFYYVATGKCLLLSNGLKRAIRLTQIASPILSPFQKSIGWPSDIAVYEHDAMVIVSTSREFGVMSLNRQAGARAPMLGSSLGRAYLAFCSDSERSAILDRLKTSDSIWDREAAIHQRFLEELEEIRRKGYATSDPQYRETVYDAAVWGFSVPIMAGGSVAATMNLIFLSNSMSLKDGINAYFEKLRVVAKEISEAIEREFGL